MTIRIISPEETIDNALRKACLILAVACSPAYLIASYRGLFIDFVPFHVTIISLVWLAILLLSLNTIKSTAARYHSIILIFFILFLSTSVRNQSIVVADVFLVIAGGLLALRYSLWTILLLASAFGTGVFFLIEEWAIFPNTPIFLHASLHATSLLLTFVLYSTIRNVVSKYQELYEKQVEATTGLLEKNKQSYLLVEEAEETKEEERNRLRTAAFSLYSQIDRLTDLIELSQKDADSSLLRNAKSRLDEIKSDLHEFSENGKFISGETTDLTISDFTQVVVNFSRPYSVLSADSLNVLIISKETNGGLFYFPMNFIKVLVHHLIEHCSEQYQATELKFEFHLAQKARSMQQIKLSLFIYSERDLSEEKFSKLNKRMEGKRNLDTGDNHTSLIKTVLRRLSGTLKASPIGNAARYDISFWVD